MNTRDEGHHDWRAPNSSTLPAASTGSTSGWARTSHGGGEAVPVARQTAMPWAWSRSTSSSYREKSNRPSCGSTRAHMKMPSDTMVTPACRMRATSSCQTSRSHWSGL